jgi:hypothetical protein
MRRPTKNEAREESCDDFKDLFETPTPSLDELSEDPAVRARIGEWVSLAMSRAALRRRPRRPY